MKLHFLNYLAVLALLIFFGCSSDPDPTDDIQTLEQRQNEVIRQLSESPWQVSSVKAGDSDDSSGFREFVLTFGNRSYSSTNGGEVWRDSGTWDFTEGSADQIIRDDEVVIDLEIAPSLLTLRFELEEEVLIGGRLKTVATNYIFVLQK